MPAMAATSGRRLSVPTNQVWLPEWAKWPDNRMMSRPSPVPPATSRERSSRNAALVRSLPSTTVNPAAPRLRAARPAASAPVIFAASV